MRTIIGINRGRTLGIVKRDSSLGLDDNAGNGAYPCSITTSREIASSPQYSSLIRQTPECPDIPSVPCRHNLGKCKQRPSLEVVANTYAPPDPLALAWLLA